MIERQYARLTVVAAVTTALLFGGQAALVWRQFTRTETDARVEVEQAGRDCVPAAPPVCTLSEFDAARAARAVLVAPRVQSARVARTRALWMAVLVPVGILLLFVALRWAFTGRIRVAPTAP